MTDYNDGEWHEWSGGECPVHPKSIIEGYWHKGAKDLYAPATFNIGEAGGFTFPHVEGWEKLKLFRVVKEYKRPREYSGRVWAYHYTNLAPTLSENEVGGDGGGWGKYTATHVDGKLTKVVWERAE